LYSQVPSDGHVWTGSGISVSFTAEIIKYTYISVQKMKQSELRITWLGQCVKELHIKQKQFCKHCLKPVKAAVTTALKTLRKKCWFHVILPSDFQTLHYGLKGEMFVNVILQKLKQW